MIVFNQKKKKKKHVLTICEYFKVNQANPHVIRGQSPSETSILKVQGY